MPSASVMYIRAMAEGEEAETRIQLLRTLPIELSVHAASSWGDLELASRIEEADLVIIATSWPAMIYPFTAWLMGRAWTLDIPTLVRVLHHEGEPRPSIELCTAAVVTDDELLDALKTLVPHLPEQAVSTDYAKDLMRVALKYRAPS